MDSSSCRIFLGPPGSGKTTHKEQYPGRFIDPEESISWKRADERYGLYPGVRGLRANKSIIEHELDWASVWVDEVLPRIRAGFLLGKDVLMGLVAPSNVELVARFLAGMRERSAVVLPSLHTHYRYVAEGGVKRPRTWGPELRGWQHTFATRTLLRGLAEEVGLPVLREWVVPEGAQVPADGKSARIAEDEHGVRYLEVFFDTWFELGVDDTLVASYTAQVGANGMLALRCAGTSRVCERGIHECDRVRTLHTDISGRPLSTWIATDKVRRVVPEKPTAVLFFVGTLAPFHQGHREVLEIAKAHLEREGWNVVGGYMSTFATLRSGRVGALSPVLGNVSDRNKILQLGLADSEWLMADFAIEHVLDPSLLGTGTHSTQHLVSRLRAQGALGEHDTVTTFWVNGTDAVCRPDFFNVFARYADKDPLNPLRMAIVDNRPVENLWSPSVLGETVPALLPYVTYCSAPAREGKSATAVREALLSGDRERLAMLVGMPAVEAYLMGKMHLHRDEIAMRVETASLRTTELS